jgi:predicted dehydrogenase
MPGACTRRDFLKASGAASVGIGLSASVLGGEGAAPPSEQVNLGFIGVGPQGGGHVGHFRSFPDVRITAICDVNQKKVEATVAACQGTATGYGDFRKLLEHKPLDAVVVATPPHWHALQAIAVCKAGKDLFVEKPMTLTVAESQAVLRAVRDAKRVSQVGTQIHAGGNYRRVVEIVRSGVLGKINAVRTFMNLDQTRAGIGRAPNAAPPAHLDWEMWVGPAPLRPYNPLITQGAYHHCSFMDFSGGWLPGMAPHIVDLPIWALELGLPTRVASAGGRFVLDDIGDEPDLQETLFQYPNLTMTWMMNLTNSYGYDFNGAGGRQRRLGIYFHGDKATLLCDYGMFKIIPEDDPKAEVKLPEPSLPRSPGHYREWVDCIKTRQEPSCSVFYHHKVNVPCCLANLSLKLGRSIQFDPKAEKVVGDKEAADGLQPNYRKPWTLG